MKHVGLLAASSTLLLLSGAVAAQQDSRTDRMSTAAPAQACLDELERNKSRYDQAELSESTREEVRQLAESAKLMGQRGREEACETMVQTIDSIVEDDLAQARVAEDTRELHDAVSVTDYDGIIRASSIDGAAVRNMENEELGTVSETVIDARSGEVSYVVLSVGGFLGVGERLVAVPWDQLRIVEGDEGEDTYYVVDASRSYLEQREGLGDDDWPREPVQSWEPPETEGVRKQ